MTPPLHINPALPVPGSYAGAFALQALRWGAQYVVLTGPFWVTLSALQVPSNQVIAYTFLDIMSVAHLAGLVSGCRAFVRRKRAYSQVNP